MIANKPIPTGGLHSLTKPHANIVLTKGAPPIPHAPKQTVKQQQRVSVMRR